MTVDCKHERIKCVNCVKICLICGAELPADFGTDKPAPVAEKAEKPAKKTTGKKVTK